ncbi:MAG: sucrase ferredoxin [Actinomycetes bacterium]
MPPDDVLPPSLPDDCALASRGLHEPLLGTAPEARGWIAVEQPGAWGRDAFAGSQLPAEVAAHLAAATEGTGVRPQVLRRPGRDDTPHATVVLLASSLPGATWMERLELDDPRELLDVDPRLALRADPPGLGAPVDGPALLVCAHARRDACCARWGRPVGAALASIHADATWETSHTGGHRFAANLVVLPEGLVYGGLDPQRALEVVATHRRGLVDLDVLRGRSSLPRAAQAADWFVRERMALRGIDDVVVGNPSAPRGDGIVTVTASVPEADVAVALSLRLAPTGTARPVSCGADPEDPGRWELLGFTPTGRARTS